MKYIALLFTLITMFLTFSGCGEEGTNTSATAEQGWHFQGRDCLACHNIDLGDDKHLLFGGTLYKNESVSNQDDLTNVCGGKFVINFLDSSFNTIYSSTDYEVSDSKGYKAKGNLFVLQRMLPRIASGSYYVQITDENGTVMAVSQSASHLYTSADYDINNPDDLNNRLVCNACHSNNGIQSPIYVQANVNLCN
ncbi:hypothetical protein [Sulfurimonas sp.]|uniref:hypothetical protein n=1 Tax=Sulfurimonas sp. TaxID=2022749 RepID=UPI003D0FB61C